MRVTQKLKMGIGSLFTDPAQAVMQAKAHRNTGASIGLLLISGILMAILFGTMAGTNTGYYLGYVDIVAVLVSASVAFVGVFLGGMLLGFLINIAMKSLSDKGGFFEGVTAIAYGFFLPVIGLFIAGLLSVGSAIAANAIVAAIVTLINIIVLLWAGVLGFSALYRGLKELFDTDMITAMAGMSVLGLAFILVATQGAIRGSMWFLGVF